MKVRVIETFPFSKDGINVRATEVGDYLEMDQPTARHFFELGKVEVDDGIGIPTSSMIVNPAILADISAKAMDVNAIETPEDRQQVISTNVVQVNKVGGVENPGAVSFTTDVTPKLEVKKASPTDVAMDDSATVEDLQKAYREQNEVPADQRWGADTLRKKILGQ